MITCRLSKVETQQKEQEEKIRTAWSKSIKPRHWTTNRLKVHKYIEYLECLNLVQKEAGKDKYSLKNEYFIGVLLNGDGYITFQMEKSV